MILNRDKLRAYVAQFNADDEELYANIPKRVAAPPKEKVETGLNIMNAHPTQKLNNALVDVTCVASNIVRVRWTREAAFGDDSGNICVKRDGPSPRVNVREDADVMSVSTDELSVHLCRQTGALTFRDASGHVFLREPETCPRSFEPVEIRDVAFDVTSAREVETVDGGRFEAQAVETGATRRAWTVRQNFVWREGEALYGLGSHEEPVLNLRGTMQYLYQQNMKAVVPVLVSSAGYGLLFNAECEMRFHDDEQGSFILLDAVGELDYYVIHGPELDAVVAGYRDLTGRVPMLPRWAFGYCQSKERYQTQEELIGIVEDYRRRKLPLDLIIQDWRYWPTGWGIKQFDAERYPDPTAMCRRIHELNAHVMLSIWPMVKGEHPEVEDMRRRGHLLGNGTTCNAYSEAARAAYWDYANEGLFKHGIDAWWCDCTEPVEADWTGAEKLSPAERREINTRALRELLGRERVNGYSLLHARGIHEHQRRTDAAKRVVNLTRSSYAGQQRYGTITWSGDICARWDVLAQQVPSGVGFAATGCPYWTTDIGGFFVHKRENLWFWDGGFPGGCEDPGYRELYTRWFQYGAFLPMFRSHGTDTPRELWHYGEPGDVFYYTLVQFLELRYRLMPYIYSLAGMVTRRHDTMMRALAFDFPADATALDIKDQYMFGRAFMVCPVTRPMYFAPDGIPLEEEPRTRRVYLPAGTDWYDFWTHERLSGGQLIEADAALPRMPLYVRAGSIVPMGPVVQYADEQPDAEWTLRVYPGADGAFTVYEDGGDGYGYEQGESCTWTLGWDDARATLLIGGREGQYPGMPACRRLRVTRAMAGTPAFSVPVCIEHGGTNTEMIIG